MTDDVNNGERRSAHEEIAALYEMHRKRMVGWLIRQGVPEDVAEEIAMDAFLAVGRRWEQLRDQAPVPYAYAVGGRLCGAYWRTRARHRRAEQALQHKRSVPPKDAYAALIDNMVLTDAVAQLPPRQREAVVLRHLQQLSVEETADIMSVTSATVKTNTRDGLRALKQMLEKDFTDGNEEE
ncbi:RNA polymerase sigma factor [Streptomyces sp. NPDC090798]|uniref:RNA polymerase sigma factor n=1 Tax=Streptomyces sp. NPDC090798 TaxID=3365968 RepID=UPI0037F47D12